MDGTRWEEFRRQVPAACCQTYLDTPSTGLVPEFIYRAVAGYQERRYRRGGDSVWPYEDGQELSTLAMIERAKTAVGRMIGAGKEDIFFGQNASQVYGLFAGGLSVGPGDNVVLPKGGWMANRFAWQIRETDGLEIRYVVPEKGQILPEAVMNLCDERTRTVCLPLVEPSTGFRIDAAAIGRYCKKRGIWFAADGVQALGVLPVDVEEMGIDFLAGNDYKWMMNYCGTGFGYVSPALRGVLKQRTAGWMSDSERFNGEKERLSLREDAGRYELGFPAVSGVYGVGLTAEKYHELGGRDIAGYVLGLQAYLRERLAQTPGVRLLYDFPEANRSAIAWLLFEREARVTKEGLSAAGIAADLKPYDNEGRQVMRIGLHYYNNQEDIDRLIRTVGKGQKK